MHLHGRLQTVCGCGSQRRKSCEIGKRNPHARVHTLMVRALDDTLAESVVWMPSHCKKGGAGTVIRGDGFLLTEVDIEMNDIADKYAKRAVEHHRVPSAEVRQWRQKMGTEG